MKDTAAARRYSRALLLAATGSPQAQGTPPEIQAQLRKVQQLMRSNEALSAALFHALLHAEQKKARLQQAAQGLALSPIVWNFLHLLISKKRLDLLPLILSDFDAAVDESQGKLKAVVQSAVAMDAGARSAMEQRLSKLFNKQVVIESSVHPELLAGVVVKAGDTVIDNSLKTQLKTLKSRFENGY